MRIEVVMMPRRRCLGCGTQEVGDLIGFQSKTCQHRRTGGPTGHDWVYEDFYEIRPAA